MTVYTVRALYHVHKGSPKCIERTALDNSSYSLSLNAAMFSVHCPDEQRILAVNCSICVVCAGMFQSNYSEQGARSHLYVIHLSMAPC